MTDKFDVLRGRLLGNHNDFHWHDFRGHTRGTFVVGIAYGCPYYKGSAIFSLVFFLSTTSEKSFIPYKASAALQALKVVQFGQSLVQLGNNFVREAEGCRWELKARNSAVQLCASNEMT